MNPTISDVSDDLECFRRSRMNPMISNGSDDLEWIRRSTEKIASAIDAQNLDLIFHTYKISLKFIPMNFPNNKSKQFTLHNPRSEASNRFNRFLPKMAAEVEIVLGLGNDRGSCFCASIVCCRGALNQWKYTNESCRFWRFTPSVLRIFVNESNKSKK